MRVTTKDRFFAALKADSRDIMPDHSAPDFTLWRVVWTREVWGRTEPGWKNAGLVPPTYALASADHAL